ncbi:TetR/AcrR family transcriptional regulator [Gordonia sp. NPDC058843]|uniref:TetR/AcrR family transcriptional regulator n=1 Tax=Gordonia sp. NPDC058843 TaxID=3346648 RepID=UPI00367DF590
MAQGWIDAERAEAAEARLLGVAEELFARHGVDAVTMADIATAARCSRATLYRYFPTRNEILSAYIRSTTERIFRQVMEKTAATTDANARITEAIMLTLNLIRDDPALGPWFAIDAGLPAKLAISHTAITAALETFLGEVVGAVPGAELSGTARWLTRTIIGLIVMPEPADTDQASYVSRYITPILAGT